MGVAPRLPPPSYPLPQFRRELQFCSFKGHLGPLGFTSRRMQKSGRLLSRMHPKSFPFSCGRRCDGEADRRPVPASEVRSTGLKCLALQKQVKRSLNGRTKGWGKESSGMGEGARQACATKFSIQSDMMHG